MKHWEFSSSRIVLLSILVVTALIYHRVGINGFVCFDDYVYILDNSFVYGGLSARGIVRAFSTFHEANWIPLTWISHMIDMSLFGADAGKHHLMSLILHLLNVSILFRFVKRLTDSLLLASFVTIFFAIHPLNVETVAWAAERKNILSTLFGLLCLDSYLTFIERRSSLRYASLVLLHTASLLSKPMTMTIPFLMLMIDCICIKSTASILCLNRDLLRRKVPFLLLSTAAGIVAILSQKAGGALRGGGFSAYVENAFQVPLNYVTYLRMIFYPLNLSVFYPYREHPSPLQSVIAALLITTITLLVLKKYSNSPLISFGWGWFLVTMIPVCGIIRIGAHSVADRYTYLPAIGIFLAVGAAGKDLLGSLPKFRIPLAVTSAIIVIAIGLLSYRQVDVWRDSFTLFGNALQNTRGNWLAHNNLAMEYVRHGDVLNGLAHVRAAIAIKPANSEAYYTLANILAMEGKFEEAIEALWISIGIDPFNEPAWEKISVLRSIVSSTRPHDNLGEEKEINR